MCGANGHCGPLAGCRFLRDSSCTSKGHDGENGQHSPNEPFPSSCSLKTPFLCFAPCWELKGHVSSKELEAWTNWKSKRHGVTSLGPQLQEGRKEARAVPWDSQGKGKASQEGSLNFLASSILAGMQVWPGTGCGQTPSHGGKMGVGGIC